MSKIIKIDWQRLCYLLKLMPKVEADIRKLGEAKNEFNDWLLYIKIDQYSINIVQ